MIDAYISRHGALDLGIPRSEVPEGVMSMLAVSNLNCFSPLPHPPTSALMVPWGSQTSVFLALYFESYYYMPSAGTDDLLVWFKASLIIFNNGSKKANKEGERKK